MASASLHDIAVGGLADLGHRVDEGDLGGQEGVRGGLHQLGGREVGDHERRALARSASRTPRAAASRPARCATPTTIRSGCRVSCTAKPSRRNSGFQASSASVAGRGELGELRGQPVPRCRPARWTCRRPGRAASGAGRASRRRRRRSDMSQAYSPCFCGVFTQTKWTSPNAADLLPGGREAQPPAGPLDPGDMLAQQLLQPRLVHRDLAPRRASRSSRARRRARAPRSPAPPWPRRGWRRGSRCRSR